MHDDENFRYVTRNNIIKLTAGENFLLRLLIENKGKVIKGNRADVRNIIRNLRDKLEHEIVIKTKRKLGYYID